MTDSALHPVTAVKTRHIKRYVIGIGVVALVVASLIQQHVDSQPVSKATLCSKFDAVGTQMLTTHILSDNATFRTVGDLANAAGRYHADTDVQAEAGPLHSIANGSSMTGTQIMNDSTEIANVCGHPLGLNSLMGQ